MGVRLDQLHSDSRHPKLVLARSVVAVLLRDVEMVSFAEVAYALRGSNRRSLRNTAIKAYERGKGCGATSGWVENVMAQTGCNAKQTWSDNFVDK